MMIDIQEKKMPKISVCVVSYNQEEYIAQCLQSIVDQKVNFEIEILISDDGSTDRTCKIIQTYVNKYPTIVRAFFQKKNWGDKGFSNYKYVHRQAKGEYVAHLDGDDCMYQFKLLKQAEYLDQHPACLLVAHKLDIYVENKKNKTSPKNPELITLSKLLMTHPVFLHSSIMYRRNAVQSIYYQSDNFIDFYLYVFAAKHAPIGFINKTLGRYNAGIGISSKENLMPLVKSAINSAKDVVSEKIINQAVANQYFKLAVSSLFIKKKDSFLSNIEMSKQYNENNIFIIIFYFFRENYKILELFLSLYQKCKKYIKIVVYMLAL